MKDPCLSSFLKSQSFLTSPLLFLYINIYMFPSIPWFLSSRNFYCNTTMKCYLVLRKINTNHVWECDAATCVTTRLWVGSDSSSGHAPEHPKILLELLTAAGSSLALPFLAAGDHLPSTDPWLPEEIPGH